MQLKLWVDFNEVYGEDVWTSLRRANFVPEGEPEIGQWVELYDHEGNVCQGMVTKVDDPIIWLRLDLSTWIDAENKEIEHQFGRAVYDWQQGSEKRTAGAAVA